MANSKNLNISIKAMIKDSVLLRFVPDHLKIEKMCKYELKSYLF